MNKQIPLMAIRRNMLILALVYHMGHEVKKAVNKQLAFSGFPADDITKMRRCCAKDLCSEKFTGMFLVTY